MLGGEGRGFRRFYSGLCLYSSYSNRAPRPFLLDVSRLIWRLWRRRLPTGIDRVCLAYLDEFRHRSLAVVQWGKRRVVLGARDSDALFLLLLGGGERFSRRRLVTLLAAAVARAFVRPNALAGGTYLNVGHTGLNEPSLVTWLSRHKLRPIYLIHDLIPITHPAYCRPAEAEKHVTRIRNALRSAAGIIVNSAATGAELERFARDRNLPAPRMLVAHLGIEKLPAGTGIAPRDHPYFLSIGTIEARKNHILLLRLWESLRDQLGPDTPDLVLIGQRGWEAEEAFAMLDGPPHEAGRIIELGGCNDADLAAWLDHARALLMPSQVEGFGLPVVEAMARRTPVIASDLPVYREITQGIPMLVHPDDMAAWREAVLTYLVDSSQRKQQQRLLAAYCPPEWKRHMALVNAWLDRLG